MGRLKSISVLSGLGLSLCLSSHAIADDTNVYVEIGPSWTDPDLREDSQHLSGLVRGGVELASWAAFEAEGIIGLTKAEDTESDGDQFESGLESQFGGYFRIGVPIEGKFLPYARIGYATAKTNVTRRRTRDGETTVREEEDSFSGVSLGFGLQGTFGEDGKNGVRLDFTGLISDGDEEEFFDIFDSTSNINLTYVRRF